MFDEETFNVQKRGKVISADMRKELSSLSTENVERIVHDVIDKESDEALGSFLRMSVSAGLEESEVEEDFKRLGWSEENSKHAAKAWRERLPEMQKKIALRDIPGLSKQQLLHFDWSVSFAVSSSAMDNLRVPMVRLKFLLGPSKKVTEVEVSRDEIDGLIRQFEAIQRSLDAVGIV